MDKPWVHVVARIVVVLPDGALRSFEARQIGQSSISAGILNCGMPFMKWCISDRRRKLICPSRWCHSICKADRLSALTTHLRGYPAKGQKNRSPAKTLGIVRYHQRCWGDLQWFPEWLPKRQCRREAHGWDDMRERMWEGRSSWLSRIHLSEALCCRRVGTATGLPKIRSGGEWHAPQVMPSMGRGSSTQRLVHVRCTVCERSDRTGGARCGPPASE